MLELNIDYQFQYREKLSQAFSQKTLTFLSARFCLRQHLLKKAEPARLWGASLSHHLQQFRIWMVRQETLKLRIGMHFTK